MGGRWRSWNMPEMTIQLRCNPSTGQRDVVIKLHDDADLLPHEHEQLHRKLVDKLIEGGLLKAGEGSRLIVERDEGVEATGPGSADEGAAQRSVGAGHT